MRNNPLTIIYYHSKKARIFNPFTPKIQKLILLADDHTFLFGQSWVSPSW